MRKALAALVLVVGIAGCSNQAHPQKVTVRTAFCQREAHGEVIEYPAGWVDYVRPGVRVACPTG